MFNKREVMALNFLRRQFCMKTTNLRNIEKYVTDFSAFVNAKQAINVCIKEIVQVNLSL